jgi:hypothetical protein
MFFLYTIQFQLAQFMMKMKDNSKYIILQKPAN